MIQNDVNTPFPDLIKNAIARKETLINAISPAQLDPIVDAELRKRFRIHL